MKWLDDIFKRIPKPKPPTPPKGPGPRIPPVVPAIVGGAIVGTLLDPPAEDRDKDNGKGGDTSAANPNDNQGGEGVPWWRTHRSSSLRPVEYSGDLASRTYRNIRAHYEVIADYLISEGHAETFSEAEYLMRQMSEEHAQDIINSSSN